MLVATGRMFVEGHAKGVKWDMGIALFWVGTMEFHALD